MHLFYLRPNRTIYMVIMYVHKKFRPKQVEIMHHQKIIDYTTWKLVIWFFSLLELVWTWKCIFFHSESTDAINKVVKDVHENVWPKTSRDHISQKMHGLYSIWKLVDLVCTSLRLSWTWNYFFSNEINSLH